MAATIANAKTTSKETLNPPVPPDEETDIMIENSGRHEMGLENAKAGSQSQNPTFKDILNTPYSSNGHCNTPLSQHMEDMAIDEIEGGANMGGEEESEIPLSDEEK